VPKTVLLETAWVLRYSYGLPSVAIARTFRGLLGLPTVTFDAKLVKRARPVAPLPVVLA